jgi:hypothetical protein
MTIHCLNQVDGSVLKRIKGIDRLYSKATFNNGDAYVVLHASETGTSNGGGHGKIQ